MGSEQPIVTIVTHIRVFGRFSPRNPKNSPCTHNAKYPKCAHTKNPKCFACTPRPYTKHPTSGNKGCRLNSSRPTPDTTIENRKIHVRRWGGGGGNKGESVERAGDPRPQTPSDTTMFDSAEDLSVDGTTGGTQALSHREITPGATVSPLGSQGVARCAKAPFPTPGEVHPRRRHGSRHPENGQRDF